MLRKHRLGHSNEAKDTDKPNVHERHPDLGEHGDVTNQTVAPLLAVCHHLALLEIHPLHVLVLISVPEGR